MQYVKIPQIVEAFIYGYERPPQWFDEADTAGVLIAIDAGDMIIKEPDGKIHSCKKNIFDTLYEPAEKQTPIKYTPTPHAPPKLNKKIIKAAYPKKKIYRIDDGRGLFLKIMPSGDKLWVFYYRFDGRVRRHKFGSYPETSIVQARIQHLRLKPMFNNPRCTPWNYPPTRARILNQ